MAESEHEPFKSSILNEWPPVLYRAPRTIEGEYILRTRQVTPLHRTILEEVVYRPFIRVWITALVVCVVDFGLTKLGWYSLLGSFVFGHIGFIVLLALLAVGAFAEWVKDYPLSRRLFGRKIEIHYTEKKIRVKAAGLDQTVLRKHRISFAAEEIRNAESQIYKDSLKLCMLVDERRIEISELYNLKEIEQFIANASSVLQYSPHTGELYDADTDYADAAANYAEGLSAPAPAKIKWYQRIPTFTEILCLLRKSKN